MKYKAVLIDDEPLAGDLIAEYLGDFPNIELVGRAENGFAGVKLIQEQAPHLLFLDIQMPRLNGFEVLELIENKPAVIFTTAFEEHALRAFKEQALDYLLKPIRPDRFNTAVQKFLSHPAKAAQKTQNMALPIYKNTPPPQRLIIKDGANVRIIPYPKVLRLKADGDYVEVYTEQGRLVKKSSLSALEKSLPGASFLRVHRSHLINLQHLEGIYPYGKNDHRAKLKNGEYVPVSRSGYQALLKVLKT
jgi:two-component system LytT family response regulator